MAQGKNSHHERGVSMNGRLKGLAMWMTVGFMAVLLTGLMVTRNLATEGTYTHL